MRVSFVLAAGTLLLAAAGANVAMAQDFSVGDRVRASPSQSDNGWYDDCTVRAGPEANGSYQVDCGGPPYMWAPPQWIQPANGSSRPSPPTGGPQPDYGDDGHPPQSATPLGFLPPGDYTCWYFSTARPELNFRVTGPGSYIASDGSAGRFAMQGNRIHFSGYLGDRLPDGWTVVAENRSGVPTVSFVSNRNSEAAFCQGG